MEKHLHELFYQLEGHHWWSVGIRQIQLAAVKKFLPTKKPRILDVGSGPGATLQELSKLGPARGIDSSRYVLELARKRGLRNVSLGNVARLAYLPNSFDVVTAFDVIEHIKADQRALGEMFRVLKPGGIAVVTTPAYMWLYDDHDRMNHHYRRYTLAELNDKLRQLGFTIQFSTYINFFLFPPILLLKLFNRLTHKQRVFNNQETGEPLNTLLKMIFASERLFVNRGVSFPFGLSVLAVAQKST